MTRSHLLLGASALVAASLSLAGASQAAVTSQVYGGGSSLIGPYLRVVADCYGNPTDLVVQGSYPYTSGESFITLSPFNFAGVGAAAKGAQNCATTHTDPTVQINFINSGSGNGELGVITHDIGVDVGLTTDGATGHEQYPSIQFGAGDYGLGHSEIAIYNGGGTLAQGTGASSGNAVTILAPGSATTPSGLTYANPLALYGNFIQFPISIDAVAIAYSPIYKVANSSVTNVTTNYKFNVKVKNKDGSGGLRMTMPIVCAIFNGAITNWNDPALKYLNGGVSLADPTDPQAASFSVPIQLDGRADSSGTTSIFYRAMAAQCGSTTTPTVLTLATSATATESVTYTNHYLPAGGKKLPSGLIGSAAGQFHTFTGTTAVATAVGAIASPAAGGTVIHGDLTYIGTDYVLPEATAAVGGVNNYGLNVVDIKYNTAAFIEPTAATALKAFTGILPPQSTASGAYSATVTANGLRANPEDWAEPISTTISTLGGVTLATPVATPLAAPSAAGAYPLVGTTNAFLNTCYTTSNAPVIKAFFTNYLTNPLITNATAGILPKAGFGVLPTAWLTAINQTFFNTVASTKTVQNTDSLQLNVLAAGTTGQTARAAVPANPKATPPTAAVTAIYATSNTQCAAVKTGA